jgi:hypothetical protein
MGIRHQDIIQDNGFQKMMLFLQNTNIVHDNNFWFSRFFLFSVLLLCTLASADEFLDSREGENVVLKCRFNEQQSFKEFSYYWARWTNALKFENVAISGIQLNTGYR